MLKVSPLNLVCDIPAVKGIRQVHPNELTKSF